MEFEELFGMGIMVVVVICQEKLLIIVNVGDSRLYIVNEEISQIIKDYFLVEEMVRFGGLLKEFVRSYLDKNIIICVIGVMDDLYIDFFNVNIKKGDMILLCFDGFINMLEDD